MIAALILDSLCIESLKVFNVGHLTNNWDFHVTNIILVQKEHEIEISVLDPSLFETPVSLDQWVQKTIWFGSPYYGRLYITNKYTYRDEHITLNPKKYRTRDLLLTAINLDVYGMVEMLSRIF